MESEHGNKIKRYLLIFAIVGAVAASGLIWYFAFNRTKQVDMTQYAPASAAAFIEIDSLPRLLSGVTDTEAWETLAPALGMSSQLDYLGGMSRFFSLTGFGPEDSTLLSRAQYAVVVGGLDLETKDSPDESNQLEVVPKAAFLIETHASASRVEKYLSSRANMVARRIYGPDLDSSEEDYQGVKIKTFRAKALDRQLIAANRGSIIIIGNQVEIVRSCIDVLIGNRPSLSQDPELKRARERLGRETAVFAFISGRAVARIAQLGGIFLTDETSNKPDASILPEESGLTEAVSSQLVNGAAYGAAFEEGRVVERWLVLMKPQVADALRVAVKPSSGESGLYALASSGTADFSLIRIEKPAEALERAIAGVSANVNVVVSFALRKLVDGIGSQYGIDPDEPVGAMLGDEIALVKTSDADDAKSSVFVQVNDKTAILPTLGRYLRQGAEGQIRSEEYKGVEIVTGTGRDERSAAFLGNYLALSTRKDIESVIDAWSAASSRNLPAQLVGSDDALVITSSSESRPAAELMLALSRVLRTTDGSPEVLKEPRVQAAMAQIRPSTGAIRIVSDGIMTEKRSAFGALAIAADFLSDPEGELRESRF